MQSLSVYPEHRASFFIQVFKPIFSYQYSCIVLYKYKSRLIFIIFFATVFILQLFHNSVAICFLSDFWKYDDTACRDAIKFQLSVEISTFNFQLQHVIALLYSHYLYIYFLLLYIKREGVPHDNKVILYTYIYIYS